MTSNIKVVFKSMSDKADSFKRSRCLLTISVGQEVHEGKKFSMTAKLVSESFSSCILLIDDTLQRHTMALESSQGTADDYLDISLKAGRHWLERNRESYAQIRNLLEIVHWDKWLIHPNYFFWKQTISQTIKTDQQYANTFNMTIEEFLNRFFRRHHSTKHFSYERAHKLCMDYLIEECSALCLWPELGCHFEVYPAKRNAAMDATHRRFVLNAHPTLLHAAPLKFKNRAQLTPQKFLKTIFEPYSPSLSEFYT